MPLDFTEHALQRMWQRDILIEDVEKALRNPIRREAGEPGTVWIYGYAATGEELKVCVRAGDEEFVITAVWASR
ncbi:hypothetical protein J2S43_006080 [Catenuloplanes nepalensis]|uniref:DUF4258 domain-containing protein n=1 Tax=Catenuloplanes nepalensis TaxID=587533 RepID=A0ABT9N237_9ACTN|nr:DUF4258 domain-containing protein [Catenuloplanes nepalensis]MDP9797568.1 hypothetical protein [Catenuloplanes nepalensis]